MIEPSRQTAVDESMELETDHFRKWVAFYDEELVGTYDTDRETVRFAIQTYGYGPYLIRQAGVLPVPPLPSIICRRGPIDEKRRMWISRFRENAGGHGNDLAMRTSDALQDDITYLAVGNRSIVNGDVHRAGAG